MEESEKEILANSQCSVADYSDEISLQRTSVCLCVLVVIGSGVYVLDIWIRLPLIVSA